METHNAADNRDSLANQLLVALPALGDPQFARSVTLVCQHDAEGAMGVMVNRPSEYTLGEVLRQMGIACDDDSLLAQPVLAGGPVHPERGFVLHDGELLFALPLPMRWQASAGRLGVDLAHMADYSGHA